MKKVYNEYRQSMQRINKYGRKLVLSWLRQHALAPPHEPREEGYGTAGQQDPCDHHCCIPPEVRRGIEQDRTEGVRPTMSLAEATAELLRELD